MPYLIKRITHNAAPGDTPHSGALWTGLFAPIMSCGEIGAEKPLKRPKESVFHRNFKTLVQINLASLH